MQSRTVTKVCQRCGKSFTGTPASKWCSKCGPMKRANYGRKKTKNLEKNERSYFTSKYKKNMANNGDLICSVCGWKHPIHWSSMCVHHVIPVQFGGSHEDNNLIILCPNCHSIAHGLIKTTNGELAINNPKGRTQLMSAIAQSKYKNTGVTA